MTAAEAVARQSAHENAKRLRADTLNLLQDVLQRLDTINTRDPHAVGALCADAKYALICMRIELGMTQ